MKLGTGYVQLLTTPPLKGLATTLPSTILDPAYSPNLLNTWVREGIAIRRPGYLQLGNTLTGKVLGFAEFGPLQGTRHLVVFTSKRQYRYDAAANVFVDITKREKETYTITAVNTGSDQFTINTGSDETNNFQTGQKFRVTASPGVHNGWYTVNTSTFSTPNTIITVDEDITDATVEGTIVVDKRHAITAVNPATDVFLIQPGSDISSQFPAGYKFTIRGSAGGVHDGTWTVSSTIWSAPNLTIFVEEDVTSSSVTGDIIRPDELIEQTDDHMDWEEMTDINGRQILMTNSEDPVREWDGVISTQFVDVFEDWYPAFTNFTTCRAIKVVKEHLMLGGLELTTGSEPQTIAWSDSGDFLDFDTGNSGIQILHELELGIKRLKNLGDRVVIYSSDAIATGVFVGGTAIFAFETIIPEGTRLISDKAILPIDVGHVYAAEENIYLFDGTRGLRIIGDIIRSDYKKFKDQNNLFESCAINDYAKRSIFMSIPNLEGGSTVYTLEYNIFDLSQMIWGKEIYADQPRAFGFWTNITSVTWADTLPESDLAATLGQTYLHWQDEVGSWNIEGEQVDFPVRVFGTDLGEVMLVTEGIATDNGTSVEMTYDTIDFTVPESFHSQYGRWGEIEFEARGDPVEVLVSTDLGHNFTSLGTTTLSSSFRLYTLPIDYSGRTLRVRFKTTGILYFRWAKVWVREGAPR